MDKIDEARIYFSQIIDNINCPEFEILYHKFQDAYSEKEKECNGLKEKI